MRAVLVLFPGTNRDTDMADALRRAGAEVVTAWHRDRELPGADLVVLPGGFSHGDYLRCGAMAARAPVMAAVASSAARGVPVLGVCNGFQILIEAGLLPGALLKNAGLRFVCRLVHLRLERRCCLSGHLDVGDIIRVPVAHGDGNYFADDDLVRRLEDEDRIVFRYVPDEHGTGTERGPGDMFRTDERGAGNPNGSTGDIAGIVNETGNVLGMMPHPEDATGARQQSQDALPLFQGIVDNL